MTKKPDKITAIKNCHRVGGGGGGETTMKGATEKAPHKSEGG